jgi:hypothetical protein
LIKAPKKLGIKGKYLNITKGIYNKSIADIIPNRENLKYFLNKGAHCLYSYSM